jgi:hypothetical protein
MTWKYLSPLIIVSSALGLIALERLYPCDRGQAVFRSGFWVDLIGYGLVQSYALGVAISALIQWLDQSSGQSRLRLVSDWPVLAQLGFFFVTHDFSWTTIVSNPTASCRKPATWVTWPASSRASAGTWNVPTGTTSPPCSKRCSVAARSLGRKS